MSIESQLREALAARADDLDGSVGDPYAGVTAAIAVSRRRRRTAALAGVAAVAVIAVAIPSLSGGLGRDTTTPAKKTQLILPGPDDPAWSTIATWPTRGSLATDTAFLAELRETSLDLARAVYAGDVGDDRVVVTVSHSEAGTDLLTVHSGDRGAPAAALTAHGSFEDDPGQALLVREDPSAKGWLLVLAPPQVRGADISRTATVHTDGTVSRTWSTSALRDGVGVVTLVDSPATLTRVRVAGYDGPAQLTARGGADPDEDGFCGNCTGQDFLDHAVKGTSYGVATTLGLRADEVTTTTLVNAEVDPSVLAVTSLGDSAGAGATGRIYVGLTRLPGGQMVRTVNLGVEQKDGGGASTGLEEGAPLDAATAEQRPVVLHGSKPDSGVTRYQVFAPGAARVQLVSDVPSLYPTSGKVAVVDGSAVLTTPSWADGTATPYRVATFDAAGNQLDTWPLDLPGLDDPYDLRP